MAKRYDQITALYRDTQQEMTDPVKWKAFLSAACRNYRLSFDDQLLVYAQRPTLRRCWKSRAGTNGLADGSIVEQRALQFSISSTPAGAD